jgi:hypothetical protein
VLVRVDGVAGADGNAHQRIQLGDYDGRCGIEPGRDDTGGGGIALSALSPPVLLLLKAKSPGAFPIAHFGKMSIL